MLATTWAGVAASASDHHKATSRRCRAITMNEINRVEQEGSLMVMCQFRSEKGMMKLGSLVSARFSSSQLELWAA